MYRTRFQVRGRGRFPLDMLRYDNCFPASSDDVAKMDEEYSREERTIELITLHKYRQEHITPARWESFGWTVHHRTSTEKVG